MYQSSYYVNKQTGTFADTLAAYGLATLLNGVLESGVGPQGGKEVRLYDRGPYYEVRLSPALREDWVNACRYFAPTSASYILTTKNQGKMPAGIATFDYKANKQRNNEYWEMRKTMKGVADDKGALDDNPALAALHAIKPSPDWPVYAIVNQMSAITAYNEAMIRWHQGRDLFPDMLRLVLRLFATLPNDLEGAMAGWEALARQAGWPGKASITASQVFNPSLGKGQNRTKADKVEMGNVDSFWLLEYLKYLGMFHCGVPKVIKDPNPRNKDRKTYVLAPVNMSLSANLSIFRDFQESLYQDTAVKMDISAALIYTCCFLSYCEQARAGELDIFGHGPEDFVAGLHTAYYKYLGSSAAVMNLSFINLPHWMRIQTPEDVQDYKEVIAEHEAILHPLDEGKSEVYTLLCLYRDFLSGQDWDAFFDFAAGYGRFLMAELEAKHYWVKPFTPETLRRLIMSSDENLSPILESEGFQNVAEAIRRSTVIPQYIGRSTSLYDVRYGLGQDLKRKAHYKDDFIMALSDFMQSYNAENARVAEDLKRRYPGELPEDVRRKLRGSIQTTDITEIVRLVDTYGAKPVCNLLVAFGYAKSPKE
jgi:hypothetical protein